METFKRNWLEEAYKIFQGDKSIKIKKEHVHAAMETLVSFSRDAEKLRKLMFVAYKQSCELRRQKGLPIPPPPPGINIESRRVPWKT